MFTAALLYLSILLVSALAEERGTIEASDEGMIVSVWEDTVSPDRVEELPENETQIDLARDRAVGCVRFKSTVDDFLLAVYLADSSESRVCVEMEADGCFHLQPGTYQYEAYGLNNGLFQSGEFYITSNNLDQVISIDFKEELLLLNGSAQLNKYTVDYNKAFIYSYLTNEMGLNCAAACGVLANVERESVFNPNFYGDGGTSYGICQWHNGTNINRLTALRDYCAANGYDSTSLLGQLHYLDFELQSYKDGSILSKLKSVPDSAAGAYEAGYYWCFHYEAPKDHQSASVERGKSAKDVYWPLCSESVIVSFAADADSWDTAAKLVPKDDMLGFSPVPAKSGYIFDGWFTSADGGTRMSYYSRVKSSMTLYARWVTDSTIAPKKTMQFDGRKYELYDVPMLWTDAKALCESLGGHLVTITSAAEQTAITAFISGGASGYYHIGCTDEKMSGYWAWVTGEVSSFSNWYAQSSATHRLTYKYSAIVGKQENLSNVQRGKWVCMPNTGADDDQHISNIGFICEYEARGHKFGYAMTE